MNNFKKTILLFLCSLVATPWLMAQEKKAIKPFYAVEANLGISTRQEVDLYNPYFMPISDNGAKLSYKTLVYGCNFMGGIELKHYFKVGLGLGYSYYKQDGNGLPYTYNYHEVLYPESVTTHRIPLYLYIRSDFLDKKISPFMDFKIGNNFLITKEIINIYGGSYSITVDDKFRLKNGLFVAANIGVAFKVSHRNTVNISVGYQSVSRGHNLWTDDYRGEYFKTGYTIIDHQFLFNLGISF